MSVRRSGPKSSGKYTCACKVMVSDERLSEPERTRVLARSLQTMCVSRQWSKSNSLEMEVT